MEHDLVAGPEREHVTSHQRLGIDWVLLPRLGRWSPAPTIRGNNNNSMNQESVTH